MKNKFLFIIHERSQIFFSNGNEGVPLFIFNVFPFTIRPFFLNPTLLFFPYLDLFERLHNEAYSIILTVFFTICESLVKLICCCFFFTFVSSNIDFFLLLFCEKATPTFLLEIANCRTFCFLFLFRQTVKLVITKKLYVFLLCFFTV